MKRKVFGSYTTIFEQYDKSRRKRDFVRLKELCEFKFGIDHELYDEMDNLIYSMYKFLGEKELYFSDYPED